MALRRLPSRSPSPLQPRPAADVVRLLRQGKPSLCPAGWGRSHPDKEFDSSNPVVRQAGREGGNRERAGRGPTLAWPRCGQAGQQGPPQRPPQAKGVVPSLAGPGYPGDRDGETEGLGLGEHRPFRQQPRNRDPKTLKTRKPQMLRHSGIQRWRQRDRDNENFRQTRYSETDVKPRKTRGDRWANVSCPGGFPVSCGSQK